MFILFALVFMRMSGAILFNPLLGRTNYPRPAKGALIFALSLLLYLGVDGQLTHEPSSMLEFGFMLTKELMEGFALGFSMELAYAVIRFASAIMDYTMGLSMAQVYDPQYNTQMTITSGIYYALLSLLFLTTNGHLRMIGLFYTSARLIPFGEVALKAELYQLMLEIFKANIALGLQLAFPLIAMELVTEAVVGQTGAIEQVAVGIDQIASVVQSNSATAEESAATSQELSSQADMLKRLVSNFKLRN